MDEWRSKYEAYLASSAWKVKRENAIARAGGRCERCHFPFTSFEEEFVCELQVHHLTYERLGKEKPSDLMVVCIACHEIEDEKRAKQGERRARNALYYARLNGWASKKYGEDWNMHCNVDAVQDEFESWLSYQ